MKVTQPKLSSDEIRRAARELVVPAMSAPVRIVAGRAIVVLEPKQYAPALSVTPDGSGRLRLIIDAPGLLAAIRQDAPDIEHAPVDATLLIVAGKPRVVPARVGVKIDASSLTAPFRAALTSSTRTATIRLVPAPPTVTTATAQSWGVKAAISTFTTQFPVNPPRTNNIKTAIATLNDTVVLPGHQFSLNATLGKRTPAKGYQKAPVIDAGRLVIDYGGGVSQVLDDDLQRRFLRRSPDGRAHPALLLHCALPRGSRSHGVLARCRPEVDQRHRWRDPHPRPACTATTSP